METIISLNTIQRTAVDAADAGQPADKACPWPLHSLAAHEFMTAYEARAKQLKTMEEVA